MRSQSLLSLYSCLSVSLASSRLYATHYDGTVSSLILDDQGLNLEEQSIACGTLPSWLTYDASTSTLYCLDENQYKEGSTTPGSFSTYSVDNGNLTELASTPIYADGVHGSLYGGDDGNSFYVIAHYLAASVNNFELPLRPGQAPLQTFTYTQDGPGPVPDRQDAPHPHAAHIDPTGSFVLVPDLGADLVRIFAIDKQSGALTNCGNHTTQPGRGPRHLTFYTPNLPPVTGRHLRTRGENCSTTVYVGNELANSVTASTLTYTDSCVTLNEFREISTYPEGSDAPAGSKLAEIQVKGTTLTVSNRADNSFGANNDSLALYSISAAGGGQLTFEDLYSTYGSFPRTMVINKAGDKVAIGNQISATVVVVERDPATGKFGRELGTVLVGSEGSNGGGGLSSVIWEE